MRDSSPREGCRLALRIQALDPPAEGASLVLSVGEAQTLEVSVTSTNCQDCRVDLLVGEPPAFEIVSGTQSVRLSPAESTHKIAWELRARTAIDGGSLEVVATCRGSRRQVMIPLRIHPALDTEA